MVQTKKLKDSLCPRETKALLTINRFIDIIPLMVLRYNYRLGMVPWSTYQSYITGEMNSILSLDDYNPNIIFDQNGIIQRHVCNFDAMIAYYKTFVVQSNNDLYSLIDLLTLWFRDDDCYDLCFGGFEENRLNEIYYCDDPDLETRFNYITEEQYNYDDDVVEALMRTPDHKIFAIAEFIMAICHLELS